ncbi:MAG: isoaspartyl peptidase/L-asparaginase [Candidatus Nezhaarchaeota archaeon]|nr:isoaspartyl peptidase/L-asparaginase [Candidatus Nezhaarchaeota archaeon]MCX8141200.1 isoaspartyl peptidase/L-asparaginase [Candidatus Nezhaarchaeota archaeon]MDW8049466.1 isoaspartyl peptidase/L-asparaginase [Nitrososphaerota archaeon]
MKLMLLHGGAGKWDVNEVDRALEVLIHAAETGLSVLDNDGSSLDAVVEAVTYMEYSGVLNAGRGACRDLSGEVSLDAGVMWMDRAGAVAYIKATWNAIKLARVVMEETPHILIVGDGADRLAEVKGLPPLEVIPGKANGDTVGAVALDEKGRLASAVSTGGIKGKMRGRVGDTPIPGAGFWTSKLVASCATGYGEAIIMAQPCRLISTLYEEAKLPLGKALMTSCGFVKAPCGLIALTVNGEAAAATTAEMMPVAIMRDGRIEGHLVKKGLAIEF